MRKLIGRAVVAFSFIAMAIILVVLITTPLGDARGNEPEPPSGTWYEAPPRPDGATCWKLYVQHHGFMGVSCEEK